MTVEQLLEKLSDYPPKMEVFMAERKTDFGYGLLNSVSQKEIYFTEDETPSQDEIDEAPRSEVLVLSED